MSVSQVTRTKNVLKFYYLRSNDLSSVGPRDLKKLAWFSDTPLATVKQEI